MFELALVLLVAFVIAVMIGAIAKLTIGYVVGLGILAVIAFYLAGFLLKTVFAVASFGISVLGGFIGWAIVIILFIVIVKAIARRV